MLHKSKSGLRLRASEFAWKETWVSSGEERLSFVVCQVLSWFSFLALHFPVCPSSSLTSESSKSLVFHHSFAWRCARQWVSVCVYIFVLVSDGSEKELWYLRFCVCSSIRSFHFKPFLFSNSSFFTSFMLLGRQRWQGKGRGKKLHCTKLSQGLTPDTDQDS